MTCEVCAAMARAFACSSAGVSGSRSQDCQAGSSGLAQSQYQTGYSSSP